MRKRALAASVALAAAVAAGCVAAETAASRSSAPSGDIHKIAHVVIIMQENRSFDTYFGTFPGADGIPMKDGVPTVCVPSPAGARASGRSTIRRIAIAAGRTTSTLRRSTSTAERWTAF